MTGEPVGETAVEAVSRSLAECGEPPLREFCAKYGFSLSTARNVLKGNTDGARGGLFLQKLLETIGGDAYLSAVCNRPPPVEGKGIKRPGTRRLTELLRQRGFSTLGEFARRHGVKTDVVVKVVAGASGQAGSQGEVLKVRLEQLIGHAELARIREENRRRVALRVEAGRRRAAIGRRFKLALAAHGLTLGEFARQEGFSPITVTSCYTGRFRGGRTDTKKVRERILALVDAYESGAVRPKSLRWRMALAAGERGVSPAALAAECGVSWPDVLAADKGAPLSRLRLSRLAETARRFGAELPGFSPYANLKELVADLGLTGSDLGQQLGCTRENVRRILDGLTSPRSRFARQLYELVAARSGLDIAAVRTMAGQGAGPAAAAGSGQRPVDATLEREAAGRWRDRRDYLAERREVLARAGYQSLDDFAKKYRLGSTAVAEIISGGALRSTPKRKAAYDALCGAFGNGTVDLWRAAQKVFWQAAKPTGPRNESGGNRDRRVKEAK